MRLWKQLANKFTPAWEAFRTLATQWADLQSRTDSAGQLKLAQNAMTCLRLLVSCYIEWVVLVLSRSVDSGGLLDPRVAADDERAVHLRLVVLRCLRNGRGDDAVAALFLRHLNVLGRRSKLVSSAGGDFLSLDQTLEAPAIDTRCRDLNSQLRHLLWPGAQVVVTYDEVHSLFDTPKIFLGLKHFRSAMSDSAASEGAAAASSAADAGPVERHDCFYGLTALMAELTDKYTWVQSMCGTWLRIAEEVELAALSPLHDRVTTVFHASHINVDQMWDNLTRFLCLDVGAETESVAIADHGAHCSHCVLTSVGRVCTDGSGCMGVCRGCGGGIRARLEKLTGRPIFFFDFAWGPLWQQLTAPWLATSRTPVDAATLRVMVLKALDNGIRESFKMCAKVVRESWPLDPPQVSAGALSAPLCLELYAAARMNGGHVTLSTGPGSAEVLRYGLLALSTPTAVSGCFVDLHREPAMHEAILNRGDYAVRDAYSKSADDPMFALLSCCAGVGEIAGFKLSTGVKGTVLEIAFAWHVMRAVLLSGDTRRVSVADVLAPLAASGWTPQREMQGLYFTATHALSGSRIREHGLGGLEASTDLHYLAGPHGATTIAISIEHAAGGDVVVTAVDADGHPAAVVLVQAQAEKQASLSECLRACSPAWQYTEQPERECVLRGDHVGAEASAAVGGAAAGASKAAAGLPSSWNPKRIAFDTLVSRDERTTTLFARAVRVALSVNNFQPWAGPLCVGLNAEMTATWKSPIALCTSSGLLNAFGARLHERLLRECAGGGPTSSTANLAFLLPQSVAAVRNSTIVYNVASDSEVAKLLATAAAAASAAKAKATRALAHAAMGGSEGSRV